MIQRDLESTTVTASLRIASQSAGSLCLPNASPEALATAARSAPAVSAAAAIDDALRTLLVQNHWQSAPRITESEAIAQIARLRDCSQGTVITGHGSDGRSCGAEAALICALQHADVAVARHGAAALLCIAKAAPGMLLKLLGDSETGEQAPSPAEALVWALRCNLCDLAVAQRVCEVLALLSAVADSSIRPPHDVAASLQTLTGCGDLEILLTAMQLRPRDAAVARHCLRILRAADVSLEAGLGTRMSLPAATAALAALKPPLHDLELIVACDTVRLVVSALQSNMAPVPRRQS